MGQGVVKQVFSYVGGGVGVIFQEESSLCFFNGLENILKLHLNVSTLNNLPQSNKKCTQ